MALDKQISEYLVDTGNFYSNKERYLHNMNCKYRRERNYLNNKLIDIENQLIKTGTDKKLLNDIRNSAQRGKEVDTTYFSADLLEYYQINLLIVHKRMKAKQSKELLLAKMANKVNDNINGAGKIRVLNEKTVTEKNIISVFDSFLTRTMGLQENEFTEDLITVQVYYFDVFKDLVYFGFLFKGKKYRYYTSSAGQIRKKKAVFIAEDVWNKISNTITCGLSVDDINAKGGVNANKYLAYTALANSATDKWEDFDIDKAIVVPDFETNVVAEHDFIDDSDFSITRKIGEIPITHTDGAGMMLPTVSSKNFMVRLPWVKGLLCVFDFRKFICEKNGSRTITDIYGKTWDIFGDDVQIIFTESQFKMHKYYDSWQEYKNKFKEYNCEACICNKEENRIPNATINYQMLQSIVDITDDEIEEIAAKSVEAVTSITKDLLTIKRLLDIHAYNKNMTPYQQSIAIYPNLINDTYTKDIIRDVKNSLVERYRAGQLEIKGKYTFLIPDLYAFCEHLFLGIEAPTGLLQDGEVYCNIYSTVSDVDCLRSPHLFREHGVRHNINRITDAERYNEISRWFTTVGCYTSTHDAISKLLQFDVDGDKTLLVADETFVKIAKRNMDGVVPLYYNMRKASPVIITPESMYAGLNAAFIGGNIGIYSNNISKIWNSEEMLAGDETERDVAINSIKRLCCQNNFVIDYAKTLYKPEFPDDIKEEIKEFTKRLLPTFFIYAKDKENKQVTESCNSFVNKLAKIIPDNKLSFKGIGIGRLDYTVLMADKTNREIDEVSALYDKLKNEYFLRLNIIDEEIMNESAVKNNIIADFDKLGYSRKKIVDSLVYKLYGSNSRRKDFLWFLYGEDILRNIKNNVGSTVTTKTVKCDDCGRYFEIGIKDQKTCRCSSCELKYKRLREKTKKARQRAKLFVPASN